MYVHESASIDRLRMVWRPDTKQKPLGKKDQQKEGGGGRGGKATKRAGKGGAANAGGGRDANKGMAAADRVEALNLKQALVAQVIRGGWGLVGE